MREIPNAFAHQLIRILWTFNQTCTQCELAVICCIAQSRYSVEMNTLYSLTVLQITDSIDSSVSKGCLGSVMRVCVCECAVMGCHYCLNSFKCWLNHKVLLKCLNWCHLEMAIKYSGAAQRTQWRRKMEFKWSIELTLKWMSSEWRRKKTDSIVMQNVYNIRIESDSSKRSEKVSAWNNCYINFQWDAPKHTPFK